MSTEAIRLSERQGNAGEIACHPLGGDGLVVTLRLRGVRSGQRSELKGSGWSECLLKRTVVASLLPRLRERRAENRITPWEEMARHSE